MKYYLIILALCPLFQGASAEAAAFPKLTQYFEDRVSLVRNSTHANPDPLGTALAEAQVIDINIDFIAQASFGLSEVFKLSITPEIDFVLTPNQAPGTKP